MTDRMQNVAPRERKPAPKKSRPSSPPARRGPSAGAWLRIAGAVALAALALGGYMAIADSATFALTRVEVSGTRRLSPDRVEEIVRKTAGPRVLEADLDAVREALASEGYVRSVTVARVLPDALRVRVEEREPAVVVRLKNGRFVWADLDGIMLDAFAPEPGMRMPPPLSGLDEGDASDRARADNRERVGRYEEIRQALEAGGTWDRVDEIDLHYLRDAKVVLADSGVVVRLGDKDYGRRLSEGERLIKAARAGDTTTLARYNIAGGADMGKLIACADYITFVDAAREKGVTFAFDEKRCMRASSVAAPETAPAAAAAPPAKPKPVTSAAAAAADSGRAAAKDQKPRKPSEKAVRSETGRRN